ncbi:Oar protein [Thalassotalea insulae]|uniref:Oar protein n=1 Tax=Thalassotalea insulae TaxID=2056778 RepID=A0ABQ6GQ27_9GAMM|nr:carboxypeptidase regulatory-like domain-containing protein [Thalassotalea insulae]GLX77497.1 Oar protein [Thalassotalea insulae]
MKSSNTSYLKVFKRSLTAAAISTVIGMSSAYAEDIKGNVVVTDGTITGVTVKAVNKATNTTRTVDVNADGSYRLAKLPTGSYEVTVSKGDTVLAKETIRVSLGNNTNADFSVESSVEVISVTGSRVSMVDVSSMDSGLTIGEGDIDRMPVARNLTSVALLAPGVVLGDNKFAGAGVGFASFGGSSVSENSCYINGLEVTNTRQGLGCGSVPFEFYNEFQVKTGGYSAKFGRATGGIINSNTKSGTNDWEFAATATFNPDSLREEGSVSRANGGTGRIFRDTRSDVNGSSEFTLSAAGPIIEDTLFIYALVNPRDTERSYTQFVGNSNETTGVTEFRERESSGSDNLFWGGKIDWDISEDHRLSYFAYSDENTAEEKIYRFDGQTGKVGKDLIDTEIRDRGGKAWSISYTGYITDDLNVSAMTGEIRTEYTTNIANQDCPQVVDERSTSNPALPCGSGGRIGQNFDKNNQTRIDIEYQLGDHTISAGYDYQKRKSTNKIDRMAGDHSWTYNTLEANADLTGDGINYANNTGAAHDYVSDRIFIGGGSFYSDLKAYYIEDNWQITDNLLLSIGGRIDEFDAYAVGGGLLTSFKTDIAPRLGFSWDVNGDGESKLYGTFGHYYLPMANNTIYRVGSGISDTTAYYTFDGIDPATGNPLNISPITGDITSSTAVSSIAVAPDREVFQAKEADPFSKQELILGYDQAINDNLSISIRGTYRTILTALDDYCGKWAYPHCVMLNPGEASSWYKDGLYWDGSAWGDAGGNTSDGHADPGSLRKHTKAEIGLPEAKNDYLAWQLGAKYNQDNFRFDFTYTWSRSTGNFEGAVKSDIGQADAGLTQDFDFAALMDGADGYQANDRRHVFKFFGSYDYNDDLTFGINATLSSGRPLSIYGQGHPSDDPNLFGGWGDFFYTYHGCDLTTDENGDDVCLNENKNYTKHPRGTAGRTSWTFNVDLSASYMFEVSGIDMRASVDVFNILNSQQATSLNEHYEAGSEGSVNQWYGAAYSWQTPRYVRFGLEARF